MAIRRKPAPKPKPKAKPATRPAATTTTTTSTTAQHPVLDVAGMSAGQDQGAATGTPETQVTTSGGPGQEGAVFSTGQGSAPQLNYQQATTYQEVYAQQQAQTGTSTGGGG